MDSAIPIPGIDRWGAGKTEGDTEGTMRVAGDNDTGRGDKGRSCAYVFSSQDFNGLIGRSPSLLFYVWHELSPLFHFSCLYGARPQA